MTKLLARLRVACAIVIACGVAACQGVPATTLAINLDACIAKVEIVLTQGMVSATQTADNPGSPSFNGFDWTKEIRVKITVTQMKADPACEGSLIAVGDAYFLTGIIPSPGGAFTLAAADLPNRYRTTDVTGAGKVSGGGCKTPTRGPGIALWVDLSGASGACKKACWQQWIKPQLFWRDGVTEKEILNGTPFSDPAGHTPHAYGQFDRDLPDGSNGNCYREDGIPGKPDSKGIVDAPGFRLSPAAEETLFGRAGLAIRALGGSGDVPLTLRFRFTVVSVLWCDDPQPPAILGYYSWSGYQDYEFKANTDPTPPPHPHFWKGASGDSTISSRDIQWHAGTAGLTTPMQAH